MKRRHFGLLATFLFTNSIGAARDVDTEQQYRLRGIALVWVTDAVAGAEMIGVKMYDDNGTQVYSSSRVSRRIREISQFSERRVPLNVRVVWRADYKPVWGKNGGIDYEGDVAGDYSIPVASRIPDEILAEIREHGGNLRLKFRLKPDGVMFGWDIQRKAPLGDVSIFERPGGDFLETRY